MLGVLRALSPCPKRDDVAADGVTLNPRLLHVQSGLIDTYLGPPLEEKEEELKCDYLVAIVVAPGGQGRLRLEPSKEEFQVRGSGG